MAIEFRDLSPETAEDLLGFFEGPAFADNPHWATCYCYAYHFADGDSGFEARGGAENRKAKAELIRQGKANGVIAYEAGEVVGWIHAGPRLTLPSLWDGSEEEERARHPRTAAVVCFVVPPGRRRQGLAAKLLEAAEDAMRRLGMTTLQGFPLTEVATANERLSADARNYHGTRSMFRKGGYQEQGQEGPFTLVTKSLQPEQLDQAPVARP